MAIQIVRRFKLHIAFSTPSRVECRINPTEIDFASNFCNFAMCLVWAVLVLRFSVADQDFATMLWHLQSKKRPEEDGDYYFYQREISFSAL